MPHKRELFAALAAVGIAACGGTGSSSTSPKQALLLAAEHTTGHSLRLDATVAENFGASGPQAAQLASINGQNITLTMHFDVQNSRRVGGTVSTTVAGRAITVLVRLYDDSAYVSMDGGATWKTVPFDSAKLKQYSTDSVLQYLHDVGTVTDEGPGTADGVSVERYHATLDGTKITGLMRSELAALQSPLFQRLLDAIRFRSGSVDATVDHQGRVVTEAGAFAVSMDLGAVQSSLKGTQMLIHATVNAHLHDYGASISVSKPANVSGSVNLP